MVDRRATKQLQQLLVEPAWSPPMGLRPKPEITMKRITFQMELTPQALAILRDHPKEFGVWLAKAVRDRLPSS